MPCYQVLRCFDAQCGTFQNHQAKKAKRWNCTVCNQRQSLRRVYFESENPAECRKVVQTLNLRRGEKQNQSTDQWPLDLHSASLAHDPTNGTATIPQATGTVTPDPPASSQAVTDQETSASRWSRFVDESDGETETTGDELAKFTTVMPTDGPRSRSTRKRSAQPADAPSNAKPRRQASAKPSAAPQKSPKHASHSRLKPPRPGARDHLTQTTMAAFLTKPEPKPSAPMAVLVVPQTPSTPPISSTPNAPNHKATASTRPPCPPKPLPGSLGPTTPSVLPKNSRASLISSLKGLNKFRAPSASPASAISSKPTLPVQGATPSAQGPASSKWGQYHGDSTSSGSDSGED
ncbi:hypothetical protein H4R34_003927 [Dimargaris verticillata]|uniref:MRN complex-interacting protein N-terminal domain-containing protein n=1 Tax=Dimargaris verticillata TaxID=2761393 RepID=A0A9W8B3L4_9FUNG|nr:hypothetical protein H4R34_003927 [Dimargaris verticillata]